MTYFNIPFSSEIGIYILSKAFLVVIENEERIMGKKDRISKFASK
jgi:hypothetical protein